MHHFSLTDSITVSDLVLDSQGTNIYARWNYLGNSKCDVTYAVNVTRNNEWNYLVDVKIPSYIYTFLYVGCQNYSFEVTPRIPSGKTETSLVDVFTARKKIFAILSFFSSKLTFQLQGLSDTYFSTIFQKKVNGQYIGLC